MNFPPFQQSSSSSFPSFPRKCVLFLLCWLSFTRARSPCLSRKTTLARCVSAFLTKTKAQKYVFFDIFPFKNGNNQLSNTIRFKQFQRNLQAKIFTLALTSLTSRAQDVFCLPCFSFLLSRGCPTIF